MNAIWLIMLKAGFRAHLEGAREISLHHLLTALDDDIDLYQENSTGPFTPTPMYEIPFSSETAFLLSAIEADLESLSTDDLRSRLTKAIAERKDQE